MPEGALAYEFPAPAEAEIRKVELGQFMTPAPVADFMADQFDESRLDHINLLDAGAGRGALSVAFAKRFLTASNLASTLSIDAYEIDQELIKPLHENLRTVAQDSRVSNRVIEGDFIALAVELIKQGKQPYTHVIINPPYKKIGTNSPSRRLLRQVGIETVNLYSAFVALALRLAKPDGEIVAIIPRSFCNGPYYRSFRIAILHDSAIKSIHLFSARDKAFVDDKVLQENVIIRLQKGVVQEEVVITTSTDASFSDLKENKVPFADVVLLGDADRFIRIPTEKLEAPLNAIRSFDHSIQEVGLQVSTGPVVDFRVKQHLKKDPQEGDAPLLYPAHFAGGTLKWPRQGIKKPNALLVNDETKRLLFPDGFYVVVKRFSSKEERRRIVASLVDPHKLPTGGVAFENHLNVFHQSHGPLSELVARGLVVYLNAKSVDDWFRRFNGHTQVNATDLRSLPFPSKDLLIELGRWSQTNWRGTQDEIDEKVGQYK
jgi:predicted RNA methylase